MDTVKTAEQGFGGDAYPGEEPEAKQIARDYTDTTKPANDVQKNTWALRGNEVVLGDEHEDADAKGTIEIENNWHVTFKVLASDLPVKHLGAKLRAWAGKNNYEFKQLQDAFGNVIPWGKKSSVPGIGERNPGLLDWRQRGDEGGWSDDSLQRPESNLFADSEETCQECGRTFSNQKDWFIHRLYGHGGPPTPVVDLDQQLPANYNEGGRMGEPGITTGSFDVLAGLFGEPTEETHDMYHFPNQQNSWYRDWTGELDTSPDATINLYEKDIEDRRPMGNRDPVASLRYQTPEESAVYPGRDLTHIPGVPDSYDGPFLYVNSVYVPEEHRHTDMAHRLFKELLDSHPGIPFGGTFANQKLEGVANLYNRRLMAQRGVTAAADPIPGPIAWMYDVKGDRIYVGHPGGEKPMVPDFNPYGVVEGIYTPKGEMQLNETTNMPVTVKHLIKLWYYMHPELEVKRVVLNYVDLDGSQKTRRLAVHAQMNQLLTMDPAAHQAAMAMMPHGNVYVVGGALRDMALGKTPKDIDLMAQGIHPTKLQNILGELPGRVDFTGKAFGVYRYRTPQGHEVEIALPRTERSTGAGHKDFEVVADPNLKVEDDLNRRDFTGNAMAYDVARQKLIDPHNGWNDLENRILRVVNEHSFRDDPLRILRGLGSVSRHGLMPDEHTRKEMLAHAPNLKHLPAERIQAELDKIMGGDNPTRAIRLAQETGVLEHFLPEVAAQHGFDQRNKHHDRELFDHTMEVLQHVAQNSDDKDLRYMALFHDIGKPESQWIGPDGFAHYYKNKDGQGKDHEHHGADMTHNLMRRLKFPVDRIKRVEHLVRHHMFPEFQTEAGARKFMNRVGPEHAEDLLTMRAGDLAGKPYAKNVDAMHDLVSTVKAKGDAVTQGSIAINGSDLISMGMKPGPQMGTLLKYLTDLVIENPGLNDREKLMQIAQEHIV